MRLFRNNVAILWMTGLLAVLVVCRTAAAGEELSDDQKKTIVYNMYAVYKQDFPGVMDISPREAMTLAQNGEAVFVDFRKSAEMEVSMLPGAITSAEFLEDPSRHAGKTVVVYCTISYRSGVWARESNVGIPLFNLKGGLLAWALEGGKMYDAYGETRRIHVYGEKWDYPPRGWESVRFGLLDRLF